MTPLIKTLRSRVWWGQKTCQRSADAGWNALSLSIWLNPSASMWIKRARRHEAVRLVWSGNSKKHVIVSDFREENVFIDSSILSCGSKFFCKWLLEIKIKIRRFSWFYRTFESCVEFRAFDTFATLTSVVKFLLLGRSGSLPRCARILSGLREDFLAGCWQTNQRSTDVADVKRQTMFSHLREPNEVSILIWSRQSRFKFETPSSSIFGLRVEPWPETRPNRRYRAETGRCHISADIQFHAAVKASYMGHHRYAQSYLLVVLF